MVAAAAAHGSSFSFFSSAAVETTTAAETVSLVEMMAADLVVETALASSSSYFFFAAAVETAMAIQDAVAAANSTFRHGAVALKVISAQLLFYAKNEKNNCRTSKKSGSWCKINV